MSGVGIIGGGLGGLAAAVTLAARGHKVTLLEKNDWLGGKAAVLEEGGYRFDMGPTILTVPRVLERIFGEAGRRLQDELDLVRLDPQWRCFFEDGNVLDLREDPETMRGELDAFAPGSGEGYAQFLKVAERLSEISDRFFFWKSIEDLRDTMNGSMSLATLRDVMALRMHRSVAGQVRASVRDERVAQMLEHFIQYVGSSPAASPAVLCGIAHMQVGEGVWYPMGGTRAVPEALARVAGALGVTVRTGVDVARVTVEGGRATGVETASGERLSFDHVVSNMDSVRTYRELVGGAPWEQFRKGRKREAACSGVVLYLGLDRAYKHLAHHNFVFSRDPEEEFDAIYERAEPAPDPTAYLAAPARTEPGVAPEGGEALYVLVHTPYLRDHHDWSKMLPAYRQTILDKLKRTGGMDDIEERIRVERVLTPQDIHERYKVLDGAIYGLASHGRVLGAFKPGNRSRQVPGLYLAGGSAHPGPGMPMALMSGWIAADTLDRDAGGAPAAADTPRQDAVA
ncbi:phytoene desaturase family protein [Roseitranquillus sediminis]|uniref:phytoene desaturase family protein n=1 Tax=Roseitranquillus sediminis TaxID=2809051 RepID=UPI0029C9D867|nr:phytoene desaturase family protein [Roseitranquillus sediminis]MBM9595185.1 phytoene desaturase [Roseitranquillus sediminis]